MKKVFFSFLMLTALASTVDATCAKQYLENRIQAHDKRYGSFLFCLELLEERNAKSLVETGTARWGEENYWGDGGSTIIFAKWAVDHEANLYSVDISSQAINNAKKATQDENVYFTLGDSIEFLKNFTQPIDFLYLDSFDFDENNPVPSQEHHLHEIVAAYPCLHEKSIVMIDDCHLPHGGKAKLVIAFLLAEGWEVLYDGYQTILSRVTV